MSIFTCPRILLRAVTVGAVGTAAVAGVVVPNASADTSTATVTGFSPAYGVAGTQVTVGLTGFTAGQPASVIFNGSATPETANVDSTSSGDESVVVPVPTDAATGTVQVTQGVTSATSTDRFTVTVPDAASLTTTPQATVWPGRVTVHAVLHATSGPRSGRGVARQPAALQHRTAGSKAWRPVRSAGSHLTGKHGQVTFHAVPTGATAYRVVFRATHQATATKTSPSHQIAVTPRVRLQVAHAVPALSRAPITGTVGPAVRGDVELQRRNGGHWKTFITLPVRHGRFHTSQTFGSLGRVKLRAVRPSDELRRTARSRVAIVQVVHREIKEGDQGADVRAVQRRLRALHYDVGAVNGHFGFDLMHAVTAFQKVQGLSDDGVVGPKVWSALSRPKRLQLRHPISGQTAVEVNLAKQVILIAKNGKIWRIIDASTAGGYYFTDSSGQQEKAVTPTGHFSVQYKVDHWVHSRLGYLYRPSYFNDSGYAIHGETAVPPYPASHGCVRMTVPAMDRYYSTFYVGESVWIYGNPPPGHE